MRSDEEKKKNKKKGRVEEKSVKEWRERGRGVKEKKKRRADGKKVKRGEHKKTKNGKPTRDRLAWYVMGQMYLSA